MKLPLLLCVLLGLIFSAEGQTTNPSEELKFYDYLLRNNFTRDAKRQYNSLRNAELNIQQKDSLNYLTGWNLYLGKQLDSSAYYLMQVGEQSAFYLKARFFSAYNKAFLKETDSALYILNSFVCNDTIPCIKLRNLEYCGIALMQNNLGEFERLSKGYDGNYYATAKEEQKLTEYYKILLKSKKKSPVAAALMSTVIPGMGKIYAGRTGEGIISFVQVGVLGLIAAESYNKAGVKSARFIASASLLSLFYIGNIWGSFFSVTIEQTEKRDEIQNAILFNMHIPLRTVFN